MNRLWCLLVLVAFPALILAQPAPQYSGSSGTSQPYQPAVPPPSIINGNGGWAGYGGTGASTAAGSAMNGMASVISAKGNYNLSTSAAAVNMTQAQKQEIQNHQQYTNTYFQMRATNKAAQGRGRPPAHHGATRANSPRRSAKAAGCQSVESHDRDSQLASLAAAGPIRPAAHGFGAAISQASHLRQTRLYRSDESPPNHRNHVYGLEGANQGCPAARLGHIADISEKFDLCHDQD